MLQNDFFSAQFKPVNAHNQASDLLELTEASACQRAYHGAIGLLICDLNS